MLTQTLSTFDLNRARHEGSGTHAAGYSVTLPLSRHRLLAASPCAFFGAHQHGRHARMPVLLFTSGFCPAPVRHRRMGEP